MISSAFEIQFPEVSILAAPKKKNGAGEYCITTSAGSGMFSPMLNDSHRTILAEFSQEMPGNNAVT